MTGSRQHGPAEERGSGADALIDQVRRLAVELRPGSGLSLEVSLDTLLDRELGFDSLSRVELLRRLEHAFDVRLPESLLAEAETPRDLLRAIAAAGRTLRTPSPGTQRKMDPLDGLAGVPEAARTLPEVLDWHVQRHPGRPHVFLYGEGNDPEVITCEALALGAGMLAAGLQERGVLPGQSVAIMLPTSREYLFSFFGILLAGAVPVPIYPPFRPSQLEDHLHRHGGILNNAQAVLLITLPAAKRIGALLKGQVETLRDVLTPDELVASGATLTPAPAQSQDVAFLQYTSGSTGQPKGVILSHQNLLANIRAMGGAVNAVSTDVFVSWLPLYHDMGLIGAWLGSLYYGMPLVLMSPLAFLTRPGRWLWTIHRHRGTLTAAPNFGYELCLSKLEEHDTRGLDLSSLRMAFNGAEPVSPYTVRRFVEKFRPQGLRRSAMAPVYGLAEAAVGLAFPPPDRGPLIDRIDRELFLTRGEAAPVAEDVLDALEFVACGQPLPGYQVRIVDAEGRELHERRQGRLEFQGPSATRGYMNNPEANQRLFHGNLLDTGDLGYLAGGDLYLTGRVKDMVIRAGRNIFPQELEEAVGDIPDIRKGCVAVFASTDPASGTEKLIVVAETRETNPAVREELRDRILGTSVDLLGLAPDEVLLSLPHAVLKTSSGKIRRSAMREQFEAGHSGRHPRALWWQVARLALASAGPRLRGLTRRLREAAYAGWAHFIFWLLAPLTWMLVAVLPSQSRRWRLMHVATRTLLQLTAIPLTVEGVEKLPRQGTCVIVANHSSYLDGMVLVAALPLNPVFVAKAELAGQRIADTFLRRIGAVFVERFDRARGAEDARRTTEVLQSGNSLAFFPEGTFTRMPGLLPFHMGAFVAAAEAGVPVVPVTINGTRSLLRGNSWHPRHGRVRVVIGAPINPIGRDWAAALDLRDRARAAILTHLEEPDLEPTGS